jgi:hypothetical protein
MAQLSSSTSVIVAGFIVWLAQNRIAAKSRHRSSSLVFRIAVQRSTPTPSPSPQPNSTLVPPGQNDWQKPRPGQPAG